MPGALAGETQVSVLGVRTTTSVHGLPPTATVQPGENPEPVTDIDTLPVDSTVVALAVAAMDFTVGVANAATADERARTTKSARY